MTCYELAGGGGGVKTMNVSAGDTVGFVATTSVSHPGPLSFWLAKAPDGTTADKFDGTGAVWFKIYQDKPAITGQGMTWPSQGEQPLRSAKLLGRGH
jgi:AA9 family protein